MNNRIKDKIEDMERFISELEGITPDSFEDYSSDIKTKAACERYTEKIVQSLIDIAFLVVKDKKFESPEDEGSAFNILFDHEVISAELRDNLLQAKGMRNILAHEYGEVDNEIVFNTIKEELTRDATEFIKVIEKLNS